MKKHNYKRIASLILVLILSFSLMGFGTNGASSSDLSNARVDTACDVFRYIAEQAELDIEQPDKLPESYAGAYLSDENTLVLCATEDDPLMFDEVVNNIPFKEVSKEFGELSKEEQDEVKKDLIDISIKEFSFNELYEVQNALNGVMLKYDIVETNLLQSKNYIEVCVRNEDVVGDIKSYLSEALDKYDPESTMFVVSDKKIETKTDYAYGGVKTYHTLFALSYGSVGFGAEYADPEGVTHYGVVTNAHVAGDGDVMKLSATKTVGTTILSTITSKVDLAFVEFNPGWARTNRLGSSNGEQIWEIASSSYWLEGAPTKKYGATSGITSGLVQSVSTSAIVSGYSSGNRVFTDVFKFSNLTQGGDSGGPVGRQTTKQVFRLYGITFAGESDGSYGYGIKYSNISAKGITAYTVQ